MSWWLKGISSHTNDLDFRENRVLAPFWNSFLPVRVNDVHIWVHIVHFATIQTVQACPRTI